MNEYNIKYYTWPTYSTDYKNLHAKFSVFNVYNTSWELDVQTDEHCLIDSTSVPEQ